jgi:phage virion morphogenesis protein
VSDIVIDLINAGRLKEDLKFLMMSLPKRKRLLHKVAKKIERDSRKRVQTQTDLQGRPFQKRWKKRSDRRKMLSKLVKQTVITKNDGTSATIAFKGKSGFIAAKQQFGDEQTFSADELRRKTITGKKRTAENSARYAAQAFRLATKRQASELRALGFRIKDGSGKFRQASKNWISSNLTVAQAGAIIRSMREKKGIVPHDTWNTVLPARSFLGATDEEVAKYIKEIYEDITKEMQRVTR